MQITSPNVQSEHELYQHLFTNPQHPIDIQLVINALSFDRNIQAVIFIIKHFITVRYNEALWTSLPPIKQQNLDQIASLIGINLGPQRLTDNSIFLFKAIIDKDPFAIDLFYIIRTNCITSVEQFDRLLLKSPVYHYLLQHDYNRFDTPIQLGYAIDTYNQSYNPIDDELSTTYTPNPTLCKNLGSAVSVSSTNQSSCHSKSPPTPFSPRSATFSTTPINVESLHHLKNIKASIHSTKFHRNMLYAIAIKQLLKSSTDSLSLWLFPVTIASASPTYLLYDPQYLHPLATPAHHTCPHISPTQASVSPIRTTNHHPGIDYLARNYSNFSAFQHLHVLNREQVHNYTNLNVINQLLYLQSSRQSHPDDSNHSAARSERPQSGQSRTSRDVDVDVDLTSLQSPPPTFATLTREARIDGKVGTTLISTSMREQPISSLYRVTDSTNEEQLGIEQTVDSQFGLNASQYSKSTTKRRKPLTTPAAPLTSSQIDFITNPPHFSKPIPDEQSFGEKLLKISENGLKLHNHSRFCETYQGFLLPLYEVIEQTFDFELLSLLLSWAKQVWHVESNYYSLFLLGLVDYNDITKYCKDNGIYHTNVDKHHQTDSTSPKTPLPRPTPPPNPVILTPYPSSDIYPHQPAVHHFPPRTPLIPAQITPRLPPHLLNLKTLHRFIIPYYMSSDVIMSLASPLCGHLFHKDNIVERFFNATLTHTLASLNHHQDRSDSPRQVAQSVSSRQQPTMSMPTSQRTNSDQNVTFFDLFPHLSRSEHIKILKHLSPHLPAKSNVTNFNKPPMNNHFKQSEHTEPLSKHQGTSNSFHTPLDPNYHGQSAQYIHYRDRSTRLDRDLETKLNTIHKEFDLVNTDPDYIFNPTMIFDSLKNVTPQSRAANQEQKNLAAAERREQERLIASQQTGDLFDIPSIPSSITSPLKHQCRQCQHRRDGSDNSELRTEMDIHFNLSHPDSTPSAISRLLPTALNSDSSISTQTSTTDQSPQHPQQTSTTPLIYDIDTLIDIFDHNEYISATPPQPTQSSQQSNATTPTPHEQFRYFQFVHSITQQDWLHTNPFLSNLHLANFPLVIYSKLLQKRQILLAVSQSSSPTSTTMNLHPAHYYLSQNSQLYQHLIAIIQEEIVQLEKCMDMLFINVPVGAWYSQQFQYIVDLIYICAVQAGDQVMVNYLHKRGITKKQVRLFSVDFSEMSFFNDPKALQDVFKSTQQQQSDEEEDDEPIRKKHIPTAFKSPSINREEKKLKLLSLLSNNRTNTTRQVLTINDLVDDICTEDEIVYSTLISFLRHDLLYLCNYFLDILYNSDGRADQVFLPNHNRNIFSSLILTCPSTRALQYLLSANALISANSEFGDKNNIWLNLLQCGTSYRDDQMTNSMLITLFLTFEQYYIQTLKTDSSNIRYYNVICNYQRGVRSTYETGTSGMLKMLTEQQLQSSQPSAQQLFTKSSSSKPYDIVFDLKIQVELPGTDTDAISTDGSVSAPLKHRHDGNGLWFCNKALGTASNVFLTTSTSPYTWNTIHLYSATPQSTQTMVFPHLSKEQLDGFTFNQLTLSTVSANLPSQKNMFTFLWSITTQQISPQNAQLEQFSSLLFKPHLPLLTLIQYLSSIDDISTLNAHIFEHLFYLLTPREMQLMGLSGTVLADILVQFELRYKKHINLLSSYYCNIQIPLLIQDLPRTQKKQGSRDTTQNTQDQVQSLQGSGNHTPDGKLDPKQIILCPHFDPKLHLYEKNSQRVTKRSAVNSTIYNSASRLIKSVQYTTVSLRFNFILQRFHDTMCKIRYNYIKIVELIANSPAKHGLFATKRFVQPSQQTFDRVKQFKYEMEQQQQQQQQQSSQSKSNSKSSKTKPIEVTESEMEGSNQESIHNNPFIVTFMKFAYLVNLPQAWRYVIFNNPILRVQSGYNYSLEIKEMEQKTKGIWSNCNFYTSPYFNREKLLYLCRVNSPMNQYTLLKHDIKSVQSAQTVNYEYTSNNAFSNSSPLSSPYQSNQFTQQSLRHLFSTLRIDDQYQPLQCSYTELDEPLFDDSLVTFYEYLQTYREYYIEFLLIRNRRGTVFFQNSQLLNPDTDRKSILNPKSQTSDHRISNQLYQPGAQSDGDSDEDDGDRLPTASEIKHNLYDFPVHPDEIYRLLHDSTFEESMLGLYFSEENLSSPIKMINLLQNPENVSAIQELVMNPILSHNSAQLLELYTTILTYLDFVLHHLRSNPAIRDKNRRYLASQPRYSQELTAQHNAKQSKFRYHYDPNLSLHHPQFNPHFDQYSHIDGLKHVLTQAIREVVDRISLSEEQEHNLDGRANLKTNQTRVNESSKAQIKSSVKSTSRPDYSDYTGFDSDELEPERVNYDKDPFDGENTNSSDSTANCNSGQLPAYPPYHLYSYRGHPFLDPKHPSRDISIPPVDHALLTELLEELNTCSTLSFHRFDPRYFTNCVLSFPLNPSFLDDDTPDPDDHEILLVAKGLAPSLLDETDDIGQNYKKNATKLRAMIDKIQHRAFIQHSTSCSKDTTLLLPLATKNREYKSRQIIDRLLYLPHSVDQDGNFVSFYFPPDSVQPEFPAALGSEIFAPKTTMSIFDIYSQEYGLSCPLSYIFPDGSATIPPPPPPQLNDTTEREEVQHNLQQFNVDNLQQLNDADNSMLLPLYLHQGYVYGDHSSYLIYNNNFQFFNKPQETQEHTCPHLSHEDFVQKPENNIIQFFLRTKQFNYNLEFFRFLLLLYPNIQSTHLFTYILNTIDNGDFFTYNLLLQMGIDKDRSNQSEELSMFVISKQHFLPPLSYSSHLIFSSILNELLTSTKAVFIPTDLPFDVAPNPLQPNQPQSDDYDGPSTNPRQMIRGNSTYQLHQSQSSYSQLQRILLHFFPATSDYIVSLQQTHRTYIDAAENPTDHIVPATATMDEHLHDPHMINSPYYQVLLALSTISPSYYCHLKLQRLKYVLFYQLPLIEMIQNTCNNALIEYSILEQQLTKQREAQRELYLDQILSTATTIHTLPASQICATASAAPTLSFQQHVNPQNGIPQYSTASMYDPDLKIVQYGRLSQVFKTDFEFLQLPRHDAMKPFKGVSVSILYRFFTIQKEIHQWLANQLLYLKFEICDIYLNNRSVFMYLQDPRMYLNTSASQLTSNGSGSIDDSHLKEQQRLNRKRKQKKQKSKFLFNSSDDDDDDDDDDSGDGGDDTASLASKATVEPPTSAQSRDDQVVTVHPYLISHHFGLCLANITNLTASDKVNTLPHPLVTQSTSSPSTEPPQTLSPTRRIYEFLTKPVDITITMLPYTRYPSLDLSPLIVLHNITTPGYVHDSSLLTAALTFMYCIGDLTTFYTPTATLNKERTEMLELHSDHITEVEYNYARLYYVKNVQNNPDLKGLTEEQFNAIIGGVLAYKLHIQPTPSNRRSLAAVTSRYQQQMMSSLQSKSGKHTDILQYPLLLEKVLSHLQSYYSRHLILHFYQYYYIMYYIQCVSHIHGLKQYFSGQLLSFLGYTNRTMSSLVKTIMSNPKLTSQIISELSVPVTIPTMFAPLQQSPSQPPNTRATSSKSITNNPAGMEIFAIKHWGDDLIQSQRQTLKVPFYPPIMSSDPYRHNIYYLPTFSSSDNIRQHLEQQQGQVFAHLPAHFAFHQSSENVSWFYKALIQSRLHISHITASFQQLYHQYLLKQLKLSTPPPNSTATVTMAKLEPFYDNPRYVQFLRTLVSIVASSAIVSIQIPPQFHHSPLSTPNPTHSQLEAYLEQRQMIKVNKNAFISSSHLIDFVDHFQPQQTQNDTEKPYEWELSKRGKYENDDVMLLKSLFTSSLPQTKSQRDQPSSIPPSTPTNNQPLPTDGNKLSHLLLPSTMKNTPPYLSTALIIPQTQPTITSPVIFQYFVYNYYPGYLLHQNKRLYAQLTKHASFEQDLMKQQELTQQCKVKINALVHKDNFGEDVGTLAALFHQPEAMMIYIQQNQLNSLLTSKDRFGLTLLHHLVSEDHHFHGDYIERGSAMIEALHLDMTDDDKQKAVIARGLFVKAQVPTLPSASSESNSQDVPLPAKNKQPTKAKGTKSGAVQKSSHTANLPLPTPDLIFSRQAVHRTSKPTIPPFISQLYCSHDLESNKDSVFVNHRSSLYQFLFYISLCFKHDLIPRDYVTSFDLNQPFRHHASKADTPSTPDRSSYQKLDVNDWTYQYMPALLDLETLQGE